MTNIQFETIKSRNTQPVVGLFDGNSDVLATLQVSDETHARSLELIDVFWNKNKSNVPDNFSCQPITIAAPEAAIDARSYGKELGKAALDAHYIRDFAIVDLTAATLHGREFDIARRQLVDYPGFVYLAASRILAEEVINESASQLCATMKHASLAAVITHEFGVLPTVAPESAFATTA